VFDHETPDRLVAQTLGRWGRLPPELGANLANDLGGLDRRQPMRVQAAEDRDAIVIHDAAQDCVSHREHLRAFHLVNASLGAREQIARMQTVPWVDVRDFPDREPRSTLRLEPASLIRR